MIECVLIRWTDSPTNTVYDVINMNASISSPVVEGLDVDLEYLVKRTPYNIPDYDPRLNNLITTQQYVNEQDSEYTTLKKWVTTYSLQARSIAEKKISVDESENLANYGVFPIKKHLKYLALAIAMLEKKAQGLTLTSTQQGVIDKVVAKANNIWVNKLNAESKYSDIDDEDPVDLDSGWNSTDPED